MALKILVLYGHLLFLIACEDFIEFSHCESYRSCNISHSMSAVERTLWHRILFDSYIICFAVQFYKLSHNKLIQCRY
jgi:hypothetical protein